MPSGLDFMSEIVERTGASDIIFAPGAPAAIWVAGRMRFLETEPLTPESIAEMFIPLLTAEQAGRLKEMGDLDVSIGRAGVGRFRLNVHRQRGSLSVATRFIPHEIPAFDQLRLPARVLDFARLPRGMVLVTGGAATGKSTTLAAMINHMNHTYAYHIITLEDPIEYTFRHAKSVVEQREIGVDSPSFASALRHVVRQRPDVVLIGEMRDLETIATALTAAEAGHLVLATLHTNSAVQTIDRIIDVFPAAQQSQVRIQLSAALQGVCCQMLFHDALTDGQVAAVEVLVPTQPIRRAIRDSDTHLIQGMVEMGLRDGMQTMDKAVADLVREGRITADEALASAQDPEKVRKILAA
ncbi:MAG TPA: PilT/PilU family type 4a pilus ATPase [Phycisphaerae bacterium]|nr:PilT/PilU family type 4a pilus ATPase [Phycisphaerae bacterium]